MSALYPANTKVRHIKSGGTYLIVADPSTLRLEETITPAYAYKKAEGTSLLIWVRPQDQMEDGRFEPV